MCFPVVNGVPLPQTTVEGSTNQWLEKQKPEKPLPDLLKIAREVCQQF